MSDTLLPKITISSFEQDAAFEYISYLQQIVFAYGSQQPILVQVDSYGGSIYAMGSLYEHLMSMQNPIVTYTTSAAFSAGAIILSTAAPKGSRWASPNSTIMVHEISGGTQGNIRDMVDQSKYLKMENKKWMDIMAKSMGLKDRESLRDLLRENAEGTDLYLSAENAKKFGIIDHVGYLSLQPFTGFNIACRETAPVKSGKGKK